MSKGRGGLVARLYRGNEIVNVLSVQGVDEYKFEPADELSSSLAKAGEKAIDLFIESEMKRQGIKKSWFKLD